MRIRQTAIAGTLSLCMSIVVAGCAKSPDANIDAARAAIEDARSSDAAKYAPDAMQSAQDSWDQLQHELDVQSTRWVKHYERAQALADEARASAESAKNGAAAARTRIDAEEQQRQRVAAERARIRAAAVRVAAPMRAPKKIKDVAPVYPAIARDARIGGVVQIEATVGQDGNVVDAHVVHSVPMLDQAALDAVQQWRYEPATQNGKAVPVVMTVNVNFQR